MADKEAHLKIYLQLPRGINVSEEMLRKHGITSEKDLVLELRKSLYGIKQAGKLCSQLCTRVLSKPIFSGAKAI